MTPCQKLLKQEGSARIESMQQSSATPKNQDSIVFGTVSSLHPTSFLMIFTLVPLIFSAINMAKTQ